MDIGYLVLVENTYRTCWSKAVLLDIFQGKFFGERMERDNKKEPYLKLTVDLKLSALDAPDNGF